MPDLTLIMPYYENAGMLTRQYAGWAAWPDNHKDRLEVILVDDGSPTAPAADVPRPPGLPALRIFRVTEDKPWHQHGARNLGAHAAKPGWMLLTDMDHVLEAEIGAKLLSVLPRLDPGTIHTLARIEATTRTPTLDRAGNPKPHPNSFVVTRDLFWRIGGYDERATGIYGTDSMFRRRAFEIGKRGHLAMPLVRYWRDIIPDASTNGLPRKEGRDAALRARIMAEIAAAPGDIRTLAFDWERVL